MSGKQTLRASLLTLLLLPILASCATTTASNATNSFCLAAKPIYWSAKDTDETIKEAKEHNAVGKKLCGW